MAMYSYTDGGLVTKKKPQVSAPAPNNGPRRTGDLDVVCGYNTEGQLTSLIYPGYYQVEHPGVHDPEVMVQAVRR